MYIIVIYTVHGLAHLVGLFYLATPRRSNPTLATPDEPSHMRRKLILVAVRRAARFLVQGPELLLPSQNECTDAIVSTVKKDTKINDCEMSA